MPNGSAESASELEYSQWGRGTDEGIIKRKKEKKKKAESPSLATNDGKGTNDDQKS